MTFLSQNTRFSRHFWACYQALITFNDVCYSQQEKSEYTHHTDEAGSIIAVEEERVEAAEKRTKGPSSVEISNSCQWQVDRAEEQV